MLNSQNEIYLDNSATTKPCEEAVQAMLRCMRENYFNPSALYARAVDVERELLGARETIAKSVHALEQNVIFTSGGTESDNLAILGYLCTLREKGVVLYSAAEHPAVKNTCLEAAALYGHSAREIPLDTRGSLDMQALEAMLDASVKMICVMQVCNETGIIMPLHDVVAIRDRFAPQAAIHVDGVQGYLRVPFSMRELNVQSYAISSHKVHGPKGAGALIIRDGHKLHPLMVGGGQQRNLRSGTENTAGILGFSAAVAHYPEIDVSQKMLFALKRVALECLQAEIPQLRVLGPQFMDADAAPHILYIAFSPVRAETLVHALESFGVMVGTGSACSSHKHKRSEVLTAMGIQPMVIDSSIRLSFAITNTVEEVRYAAGKMIEQYKLLARFTRR